MTAYLHGKSSPWADHSVSLWWALDTQQNPNRRDTGHSKFLAGFTTKVSISFCGPQS